VTRAPDDDPAALPAPLPLFPLQTVLYPGARLLLKIFEARYLDLMSRCLREQTPFGVVCLREGREAGEGGTPTRLEAVGALAWLDEVDAEQTGILRVRCHGGRRFRMLAEAERQPGGLWVAPKVELLATDGARSPGPAMHGTVKALASAIAGLQGQGRDPFDGPHRFDDAGWVANRWCELLPIQLAAKQKLMELEDPVIRLSLVDAFLRDKKVVVG
jgi:Lon protease-like protein